MSTIGVPSRASSGRTLRRPLLSNSNISTRCKPMGLGRSGERVANTPRRGTSGFPRGWTLRRSRLPLSSHVRTRISCPATRPSRASAKAGPISSRASGPPSWPCLGHSSRDVSEDRTTPMGSRRKPGSFIGCSPCGIGNLLAFYNIDKYVWHCSLFFCPRK
jgi:hypothetical protein